MDFKVLYFGIIGIIFLFFISCSSIRGVQRITGEALMYGMVFNSENMPVPNAQVVVDGSVVGLTDFRGRFILSSRRREEFSLSLVKQGYETVSGTFRFEPMEVIHLVMINAEQLIRQAEFAMDEARFYDVVAFCERALALNPQRIDASYLKALALFRLREYERAGYILHNLQERIGERDYINRILERLPQ